MPAAAVAAMPPEPVRVTPVMVSPLSRVALVKAVLPRLRVAP